MLNEGNTEHEISKYQGKLMPLMLKTDARRLHRVEKYTSDCMMLIEVIK